MDRWAWWAKVDGLMKSQTRLSDEPLEIWKQKLIGKLNVIHKTITTENNMLSFSPQIYK